MSGGYKRPDIRLDRTPTPEAIEVADKLKCSFIMLGHGVFTLVDNEDVPELQKYCWKRTSAGHAVRVENRNKIILLSRMLMKPPSNLQVDHKNLDKLDNRKSNLRLATPSQNAINKQKYKKGASSKFKGVYFQKACKKWIARMQVNHVYKWLGSHRTECDAALAYDRFAIQTCGEFARTNFPTERTK